MLADRSGRYSDVAKTKMIASSSGRLAGGGMDDSFMLCFESGRSQQRQQQYNHAANTLHPNIRCDLCNQMITSGARYKCLDCADFDLCAGCEARAGERHGGGAHTFAKIRDSRKINANAYLRN